MPPEEKKERIPIKSLRTYQGDVEEAIGKNKESSTTIFVAEQKRKESKPIIASEVKDSPFRNKLFISIGSLLFVLGLAIITTVYYIRATEKTIIEQKTKALLTFSKEKSIDISSSTRESLLSAMRQERETFKLPVNSILFINTTSGNIPAKIETILSLVAPSQPDTLTRSFGDKYMFGVYSYDTNEIFIILKVSDFASSYSGMLKWEKEMPKDLQRLFGLAPELLAESVSFSDLALKNKDLRVLKDFSGKTQLLYSFINKDTLVITKNESIFSAIIGRLSVNEQSR